jgi:uncharacterized protein with GYD domain
VIDLQSACNWTDQGTKDFRGAVERANSFGQLVEQAGGRVRELVWTLVSTT